MFNSLIRHITLPNPYALRQIPCVSVPEKELIEVLKACTAGVARHSKLEPGIAKDVSLHFIQSKVKQAEQLLEEILQNNIHVTEGLFKEPLLHMACHVPKDVNTNAVIRDLIKLDFACDTHDDGKNFPLDLAAMQGNPQRVKHLIKASKFEVKISPKTINNVINKGIEEKSADYFKVASLLLFTKFFCVGPKHPLKTTACKEALTSACRFCKDAERDLQPHVLDTIGDLIIKVGMGGHNEPNPLNEFPEPLSRSLAQKLVEKIDLDQHGSTIWHVAIKNNDQLLLQFLCRNAPVEDNNINRSDNYAKTPTDYAPSAKAGTYELLRAMGGQHKKMTVDFQATEKGKGIESFPSIDINFKQSIRQFFQTVTQTLSQWISYLIETIGIYLVVLWCILEEQAEKLANITQRSFNYLQQKYIPCLPV